MVGAGRTIGTVLIVIAILIVGAAALFVYGQMNQAETTLQSGGATLAMGCAILVAAIVAAFGVWFFVKGRTETTQFAEVEKEKRILNMVQTQGTIQLSNVALETNMPMDQVKAAIYDLVGKGLWTGYIDWKVGKLVSSDAAQITQSVVTNGKCPNCGGQLEVGGKGVITCPYCGAEIFLPKS